MTRIGIVIFACAALLGPLFTVREYSVISNVISQLGAQHAQNNFIIVIGFVALGGGISIDGLRYFKVSLIPFILFGVAMAIVGFFPHKPLDPSIAFNSTHHNLHGIIASIAGTAITIGFIWQGIRARGNQKIICFYMALISFGLPLLMLALPHYQGLIQRVMYLQILSWMWFRYPVR